MPSTETSPEPALERVQSPSSPTDEAGPEDSDAPDPQGLGDLIRDLAEDTRTLVQQEVELVRLELAHSAKRITRDGAWIGAGALIATVGLLCLALAAALGIGALVGSYWIGTLITAFVFLIIGGVAAWRGIRDLKAGGLMPSSPLTTFEENREWAQKELDDLKKGISEDL